MLYFQTLRVFFVEDDLSLKKYGKMIRGKQITLYFKPPLLDCPFLIIDKYVLFCKGLVGV